MRYFSPFLLAVLMLNAPVSVHAEPLSPQPKAVPETRSQLKQALDDLKRRQPRLPLPPASEELKAKVGDLPLVNNVLMRAFYLPGELRWEGSWRTPDPNMRLERPYKTMFFWIVARANNCHYCLGHQESGLKTAGLSDDAIAALDGDWSEFSPAQRAAFALVRKITYQPYEIESVDLEALRPYYTELQILEIVLTASMNNEMSRWTDAMGIPQEAEREYLTPASAKYKDLTTRVAAIDPGRPAGTCAPAAPPKRPPLEDRAAVELALLECRQRAPRLPLVDEQEARALVGTNAPRGPLPQWVRLLANFPVQGLVRIRVGLAMDRAGVLDPLSRARIAWIAARQDRAWYAIGCAKRRLRGLGVSEDDVYALDGPWNQFTAAEQVAFALVLKLTSTPQLITDEDIAGLRRHYSDREVAEWVHHTTLAAFFDRLTETAGLALEAD